VAGVPIYRTGIAPEWIDYNGHLRDAYYGLIVSYAIDALMERIGLDAPYRERTGCTLYTLEMHIHYLREIKASDTVMVDVRVLGADRKRIHAAFELLCEPRRPRGHGRGHAAARAPARGGRERAFSAGAQCGCDRRAAAGRRAAWTPAARDLGACNCRSDESR
jgi:acyl-CoA thioesterase FadM